VNERSEVSTSSLGPLLARGRTAEVYAWNTGQILKLFYSWCPDHLVQIEVDSGRIVTATNVPTPALVNVVDVEGRKGIVYERANGMSMLQVMRGKPWLMMRMARQLAELHAEMHKQDGAGLPSLRTSLAKTIQRVETLAPDTKARVLDLLGQLPDSRALCHFDLHPDQVLMTPAGPVTIDWMTAQQGHQLADVARTAVILAVGRAPDENLWMRILSSFLGKRFSKAYVARYLELHPGTTEDELRAWMLPVAAARLREEIPDEQDQLIGFIEANLDKASVM